MNAPLDIQDLSIVLSLRNYNPAMLTPDLVKGSGIVPVEWELAQPPVLSNTSARLVFQNGMTIAAEPGRVTFMESLPPERPLEQVELGTIANQFASTLHNLLYVGVGINPRRFVGIEQVDVAHRYLTETILSPGDWQHFGNAPMQAGVNLVYTLERSQLRLAINEARLNLPDRELPAVVFGGNFHYNLQGDTPDARVQDLHQVIDRWRSDVMTFRELLDQKFLANLQRQTASFSVA